MNFGEKLKTFRQTMGITQESLASELHVSAQAVSKWERQENLPDLVLVPRIAELLGVSCDALLTDDGRFSDEEIAGILTRCAAPEESETDEEYACRLRELEDAHRRFPRSFPLMHALAQAYSQGEMHPAAASEQYVRKSIRLEEAIAANCPDVRLRAGATEMLCYLYPTIGRFEDARLLAGNMPEFNQTRLALLHHGLEGMARTEAVHDCFAAALDFAECYFTLLLYGTVLEEETAMFDRLRSAAEDRTRWHP